MGDYVYYFHDNLGSTRALYDQNKAGVATYEYTPYGEPYTTTGGGTTHRFTSHEWDETARLYYAPYRYYSAPTARWLTRDPLGVIDGPNLYTYASLDPVNNFDLLGLHVPFPPFPPDPTTPGAGPMSCDTKDWLEDCRDAAENIRPKWIEEYPGTDPYPNHMRHCNASADLAKQKGALCAYVGGWGNEFEGQFEWNDVIANHWGIWCSFFSDFERCCRKHAPR